MPWIDLIARALLATVFLVAGVGKLRERQEFRRAVAEFGVPDKMAAPIARVLPLGELAVAALLVPNTTARWGAGAALTLLALFSTGIVVSLARGRKPNCHCFGQLHSSPIGWSTVTRNGILAAVAALLMWRGENVDVSAFALGAGFAARPSIALAAALIAIVIAAIEAWLLVNLMAQQGRLLIRLEATEKTLGLGPGAGLPVGQRAPEFELRRLSGDRLTLAALRGSGRRVLLFFTNPDCGPCEALLPDVARWQREHRRHVTIAVISHGSIEVNHAKVAKHDVHSILLQKEREVTEAYQVSSTPAAVLVGADGTVASRIAYGAEQIEALLQHAMNGTGALSSERTQDIMSPRNEVNSDSESASTGSMSVDMLTGL
jgi:methylamine dehydrogenase accessory protein MauD